jgi:predicted small secreted protein
MKKVWMMLALLVSLGCVAGCGTLRGIGEDVEDAGDAVQDAAN